MKLASYRRADGTESWGVVVGSGIVDCSIEAPTLRQALTKLDTIKFADQEQPDVQLGDVQLLPPIPDPEKILCVGLNYTSHIKEGGREPPEKPIIFVLFPNIQVGDGQPLIAPNAS